ncbi:hypothetical protein [Halocella sp. SP3-1]|uniref:hypothetical protein n=1 Tax=Halocella sp. SP3-1 TaxID=2382161 RepID=UPI000F74E408|nr:hypothetical protein [Halocella sp. SP3-1]AZO96175.1 hypothetical protein D7D81_17125 [Halocella sp. SP3-1]
MGLTKGQLSIILPQKKGTSKADGYAGHYICSPDCLFRLHHHVLSLGGQRYRISSVGHMIREGQPEEVAHNALFETMVFNESEQGEPIFTEIETIASNNSIEATENHYKLVEKYKEVR